MDKFNKKLLCVAVASSFATAPIATTMAADVGNFFNADSDSKVKVGIFYNNSKRDVEQEGTADLWTESSVSTEDIGGGVTETTTETVSSSLTGISAEEQNEDLFAKISYAVTPKIELYAKLGVTRTELDDVDDTQMTESSFSARTEVSDPPAPGYPSTTHSSSSFSASENGVEGGDGDLGIMVGIGGKLTLAEFENGWRLGLDG